MLQTNQEIFDQVADHLLTQNRKSMHRLNPKYKHPNGDMCAIGCLFPENVDLSSIEGRSISPVATNTLEAMESLLVNESLIERESLYTWNDRFRFIEKLQKIHDNLPVERWKTALEKFALIYKLDKTILQKH